jgi:hypothetical protein
MDGKQEDKKENYNLTLVLERLFKYMFQKNYGVTYKKTIETHKKIFKTEEMQHGESMKKGNNCAKVKVLSKDCIFHMANFY